MIAFPNAKINIGLNITEKRTDGYHNLESVFYPVPLRDALEIVPSTKKQHCFTLSGLSVDGDPEQNLVMKALRLLADDYDIPHLNIYLEKNIPFGAGLGGGSADGTYMLKLLNNCLNLNIPDDELEKKAAKLGADCPFFIKNRPTFVSGTGNILEPLEFSLKGFYLILVKPPVYVSTREAYSMIVPKKPDFQLKEEIKKPVKSWKNKIVNDFEAKIIEKYPVIGEIKNELYASGALYASMSGSGSSIYGIFSHPVDLHPRFQEYYIFQSELQ